MPAFYVLSDDVAVATFKAGYTSRSVEQRASEIARTSGRRISVVQFTRMPHAWAAEQLFHARASRSGSGMTPIGHEWYRVSGKRPEERFIELANACAKDTEKTAKRRFSWPKGAEAKTWRMSKKAAKMAVRRSSS